MIIQPPDTEERFQEADVFSYYGHKSSICTDVPGAWSAVIAGLIVYSLIKNGYDRFDQMPPTNSC